MTDAPNDDEVETLATLIRLFKGRRSYRDLGAEAGEGLGWSRWRQLGDPNFALNTVPKPETVITMSRVLRVPQRRIWLAIGREMGLDVDTGSSPFLARMVARTSALSQRQQNLLLELIAEFVDLQVALAEMQEQAAEAAAEKPVRQLRAARKTTGTESRGPRGGARTR